MISTDERVARVEAILRGYGFHEPTCPAFATDNRQPMSPNRMGGMYWVPQPCACWLKEEPG